MRAISLGCALFCSGLALAQEPHPSSAETPAAVAPEGGSPLSAVPVETPLALLLPGLSSDGGIGLPGMPTAASGPPWQFRAALWMRGFAQSDFLIAGDRNGQLVGGLQLDATLGRHVEAWIGIGAGSNQNDRNAAYREDPALITSLGDLGFGVKLHGQVLRDVHLALRPYLSVSSAGGDLGADFSSTSPGVDLLASIDLSRLVPHVPLRLHFLIGYLQDRSSSLLTDLTCHGGTTYDCAYSRIVTTAAYGIRQPRLRMGLGADAAFALSRYLALGPIFEYHLEAVASSGDDVLRNALSPKVSAGILDGRVAQWMTFAARLHTAANLTLDIGFLAGLSSPGFAMGSPVPQVAGYGALTWTVDLLPGRTPARSAMATTLPPPGNVSEAPTETWSGTTPVLAVREGRVHGIVRDRRTSLGVPGAMVRFPGRRANALLTDDLGEFDAGPFPAGPLVLLASRPEYEDHRVETTVAPGQTAQVNLYLPARAPAPSSVRADILNEKGLPIPATVTLLHGDRRVDVPPDIAGGFLADAPAGEWNLRVDSDGYLAREQQVALTSGVQERVQLVLRHRPLLPSVRLGDDFILLKGTLVFEPGTAVLTPQSSALLDEVADLLILHPELRRVRIEGHTDNVGKPQVNQELSEERARAVRTYLTKLGVSPDRLIAEGFGASQPMAPNLTPQNRLKNRRVVFKILDRGPKAR